MTDLGPSLGVIAALRRCCYVDVKSRTHESSFFLLPLLCFSDQRETCCYAWHGTRPSHLLAMRPSKAQSPGISVSRIEPSGVFPSRFSTSSSRSLGQCLLLGQRSRMNFLSDHIGPLFHQHRSNPCAELARHGDDGHPRTHMPRVSAANRAVKLPKLSVLANRRPGRLDEFTPQPAVSGAGDRAAISFLSRRVLGRNQPQKSCELAHAC